MPAKDPLFRGERTSSGRLLMFVASGVDGWTKWQRRRRFVRDLSPSSISGTSARRGRGSLRSLAAPEPVQQKKELSPRIRTAKKVKIKTHDRQPTLGQRPLPRLNCSACRRTGARTGKDSDWTLEYVCLCCLRSKRVRAAQRRR